MKRIAKITPIKAQESKCIITSSDRKLFRVNNTNTPLYSDNTTYIEHNDNNDNNSITFNLETPHTLKTNNTAFVSHNSVLQRSIIFSCILRPESWFFVGIDLKMVELTQYVAYSNVVLGVAITLENALEVLRFAQQTMMSRYEMMSKLGINNFLDLPEKGRALMVMIDEYGEAASPTGSKTEEGKEADNMKGEIQMIVGSIARLGRAAGVHLVIATQRPDAKMLPGETKDIDISTKILTNKGWKTMKNIEIGDQIFDEKGNLTNVINTTEIMNTSTTYKIKFSTGESIIAGSTHKWPIFNDKDIKKGKNNPNIITTQEMFDNLQTLGNSKYALQVTNPLDIQEKELPINPWLLGIWLGNNNENMDSFTTITPQIKKRVEDLGYTVKEDKDKKVYEIIGLKTQLRENNLLNNKHIPNEYLLSSIRQRKELLAGLLDSNGSAEQKQASFVNNNKNLSDKVLFLARSLGHKASINHQEKTDNSSNSEYYRTLYNEYWNVIISTNEPVFTLENKNKMLKLDNNDSKAKKYHYIEDIQPVETVPTKCIQVDNNSSTYLAGESLIPTHNSNLGARINCGYANPIASSMILDNAEGTKVKSNPKGRFYIRIYSNGNHGQAFFAKEDWMDKYLENQGLNPDGSPKNSPGKVKSALEEAENAEGGAALNLKDDEDTDSKYDRPEDDWDDDLDNLIEENNN